MYLPDDLNKTTPLDFYGNQNFKNYCPSASCNTELEKNTIGFLWLLGECYSAFKNKSHNINSVNAFFIYIISWFSYKLNQNKGKKFTTINDFFTEHVKTSGKYERFINDAYRIGELKGFMDERNDLLDINIEDLHKFYDASKLLCNMYMNAEKNNNDSTLLNDAKDFVKKYTDLNESNNIEGTARIKILSALSTDYNNLKKKCTNKGDKYKDFPSIPETIANIYALKSGDTSSSSSIGNKLFTVLSIFVAIAFFLGISYKYSLFGFRKRFQKQKLGEKIKNIKKKMNH
ncbi:PIR protein [Plasmodium yoelii yoelii]|uniref:PIR protein n=3 Tax=Plasmodium yoelii TaxID=5861 RepID=A0AAE9WUQ4_PLAYO|nr:PIR protein [Plasmodium yoelii yoelii]